MPAHNFTCSMFLSLYSYVVTQVNTFCVPCGLRSMSNARHTCGMDTVRSVLFHPISNVLRDYLLRVVSNTELVAFSLEYVRHQILYLNDILINYGSQPGVIIAVRATQNARLMTDIFNYILAQRNSFCAACELTSNDPIIHTCTLNTIQQVLYNPLTDSLADYLSHIVSHEALVDLLLPPLRLTLLEYHEDLLAQGDPPTPVDVIDLTED